LLSELRLPCLPQLRDFGEAEGRLYLVTDFIEGRALDEHCAAESLSLRQRVAVLARVAHALQSLHERRLIHRDIKPANILIGAHGDVVIVDLGIAALFGENATQTITSEGVPIGSPAFMSPEQARGERSSITTRSDVYSLGATAYRILTGSTPHDTDTSLGEAIRRVGQDAPRDPIALRHGLPRALAAVLRRCVAPDPRDRYPTAEGLCRGPPTLPRRRSRRSPAAQPCAARRAFHRPPSHHRNLDCMCRRCRVDARRHIGPRLEDEWTTLDGTR
jgi:serine/threonine protein kinase